MNEPVVIRHKGRIKAGETPFKGVRARIDISLIDKAKRIGNNNLSLGIRRALAAYATDSIAIEPQNDEQELQP